MQSYLGVTLQRSPRVIINIKHDAVRTDGKINTRVDDNFGKFLVNLFLSSQERRIRTMGKIIYLLLPLLTLHIGFQGSGNTGNLVEESKFPFVKVSLRASQNFDHFLDHILKDCFAWILLMTNGSSNIFASYNSNCIINKSVCG